MAVTKLSVSVDEALVAEVRRRVGERGVSAFVTRAVRHELERERLKAFLDELEEELGPPDEATVAEAEAAFDRVEAAQRAAAEEEPSHRPALRRPAPAGD